MKFSILSSFFLEDINFSYISNSDLIILNHLWVCIYYLLFLLLAGLNGHFPNRQTEVFFKAPLKSLLPQQLDFFLIH